MKILHVILGLPKAAGTSVFCGEVCNGLVSLGHEVTVAVVNPDEPNSYPTDSRIKILAISSLLNNLICSTCSTCLTYDLVHIHALWEPVLHKVARWARRSEIPIVWSPHGMLTPWALSNKKWKKMLAWWLYQRRDINKAILIHATAKSEVEDVRRMRLKNRVLIAPLGVSVKDRDERVVRSNGKRVLLFVSRVQRKKGLVNLIYAWQQLPSAIKSKWLVRVVGPDQEGHTAELKKLCAELSVESDFDFIGAKYGEDLTNEYLSANLFVLPTLSENFGSVVIESLAHGVPVICTKGAPWEELETHKCGWWIDIGVEPLVKALKEAMFLPRDVTHDMGVRGKNLVEEKYTWKAVVSKIEEGYKRICNGVLHS